MSNEVIHIGEFSLVIPSEKMFDVATLKIDLRPTIAALEKAVVEPKRKPSQQAKSSASGKKKYICRHCGNEFVSSHRRFAHTKRVHKNVATPTTPAPPEVER